LYNHASTTISELISYSTIENIMLQNTTFSLHLNFANFLRRKYTAF